MTSEEGVVKICLEILKALSRGLEESLIYRRASKVSVFQYPNTRNDIVWCNVSVGYWMKQNCVGNLPDLNPVAREQLGYHYQDNLQGFSPNTLDELRKRLRLAWKNVL